MAPYVLIAMSLVFLLGVTAYDPDDPEIAEILLPKGQFEAFYPNAVTGSAARAPHAHGTFFKHRHPALVDAKNSAAYGYRFDGGRRFNFDK